MIDATAAARPSAQPVRALPANAHLVLAMLLLVYIFNFLDRMMLSILAAPIQADLGLSDSEMGLLGGLAFAVLYSTLAVPLSALADRTSRSAVITVSLLFWSAFTALCGVAQNFWQIFLARVGVGVGEAGGVAPSYAMIADYFPPRRRSIALAIYSLGVPVGSAIGVLGGGYIASTIDWRVAFFVMGGAGLLIAPLFRMTVKDVPRTDDADTAGRSGQSIAAVARILAAKPSFGFMAFGAATSSALGYGIGFWMPSFLLRSFGLSLIDASLFMGGVLLIGGVTGMLAGGALGDRMGARKAWYPRLPAIAFFVGTPLMFLGVTTDSVLLAFVLFLIPQGLNYVWFGPVLTAVQHLVEPQARATASALFLLINNLIGLGGGIYALGALSDLLGPIYGDESLRMSIQWALPAYLVAGGLMLLATRTIASDWVEEA
ncbi:spinster family MFS transporter [Aurantiacibacter spongiae]|uniref:MFS transporter n=1 Tax=Aurantiacibacter spongiae TaxID=2488860 RepID=A0A3N5CQY6_9SPHN|nr:MFS transporter [Aurantiacibacter spongiae]RPF70756.1 MFS transporter [Aurantiacibacter spongiae]